MKLSPYKIDQIYEDVKFNVICETDYRQPPSRYWTFCYIVNTYPKLPVVLASGIIDRLFFEDLLAY